MPQSILDALGKKIGRFPPVEMTSDKSRHRLAFAGRNPGEKCGLGDTTQEIFKVQPL